MKIALAVSVLALTLAGCSNASERTLLTQFFAASRLRDLTALRKFSTVVFEPASDGVVTGFDISSVAAHGASKEVSISAPVRLPDGRVVVKHFAITIEDGLVTAINERTASPSIPRP